MQIARWHRNKEAYLGTVSGGLKGAICPEGHFVFPPNRIICPACIGKRNDGNGHELENALDGPKIGVDAVAAALLGNIN